MTQQPFSMPSPYPASGEVIDGKYQIERILGEGGMGAVAKAQHLLRRAPVALKFMSPAMTAAPGAVERFINEAVAASQIDSDHVVKIFDVATLQTGAPYLVMEYLEGCDLADLLHREGQPGLPIPRAVHFILQVLRGLQVAHAAGIVHRDMKPSNVFIIHKDGEPDFVKLVDFGISKVQQPGGGSITRTNSALGTPLYMSPEQARSPKDVDLRSDLYSVGVILYELLTGRTPFFSESGEFTEILFKIFTMDVPPIQSLRPDLPAGLCAAIHGALTKDPRDRYASAADMADALSPWSDERSQQVVLRLRNLAGRGSRMPSQPPPAPGYIPQSVVPPMIEARATQEEAGARTQHGSIPPAARTAQVAQTPNAAMPPPPLVPGAATDIGVTRDTSTPKSLDGGSKKSPLVFIAPAFGVALVVAAGIFVYKSRVSADPVKPTTSTTVTATTSAPAPPPAASSTEVAQTAQLPPAPAPDAGPPPKASATGQKPPHVPATTTTTTTTAPVPTTKPTELNQLKPRE
jgi:serine/threonine-protein kinase